jgi:excisionase family DNA binding protein
MKSSNPGCKLQNEGPPFEGMVGIDIVQNQLLVPKKTIYKWVHEHRTSGFPYYKVGRHLRFRLTEVESWLRTYHWSGSVDRTGRSK